MKRKRYMSPAIEAEGMSAMELLAASGVRSDKGIGYGGVDSGGTKDPSAPGYDDYDEEGKEAEDW